MKAWYPPIISLKKVTQCCQDKRAIGKPQDRLSTLHSDGGMSWILTEALVGSRNSPLVSGETSLVIEGRRKGWPESSTFGYFSAGRLYQ
jgi:hypothetical protein